MKKNILILTTSYGQGHLATAHAIEAGLKVKEPNIQVEIVDFTEVISSFLNKTSKRMYEDTSKFAPLLYKLFFESTDYPLPVKAFNDINYRLSREKILEFFNSRQPNLIVCNSPHWQYLASLAREEDMRDVPLISVITDSITLHAAWAIGNADGYIVPNAETAHSLEVLGVDQQKVHTLGYPIDLRYGAPMSDKANFLGIQNLDPRKKLVLVLAAGLRSSMVQKTVLGLQQSLSDAQVVVITGRDSQIYPKLKKAFGPTIHLVEWTDEMPSYVRSADVIVTKAGGSTVMECIGASKPVIISKIIPGQEEGNAEYITKHSLGIVALDPDMIAHAATKIIGELAKYKKSLAKVAQPKAALTIAEFLIKTC